MNILDKGASGRRANVGSASERRLTDRFAAASVILSLLMTQSSVAYGQTAADLGDGSVSSEAASPESETPAVEPGTTLPAPVVNPVEQCLAEHTDGQTRRNQGELLEARTAFRLCSQSMCPGALRADCLGWNDELRAQIPSVTFRVVAKGANRTDARVYVNGEQLTDAAGGRAIELNPGVHQLRFELDGYPPIEQELLASEGERYRMVTANFESIESETPAVVPVAAVPASSAHMFDALPERPVPAITYIFLGLGVVGAISAGAWGMSTIVAQDDLEATCSPNCPDQKIQALEQRALLTDISAGVGVLSLAIAGIGYLVRPEVPVEAASPLRGVSFETVAIQNDGVLATLRMRLP